MYLKIQGLVLRVTAYNDSDSLLTLLSNTHGKLTVKARGVRRRNSPLTAPCQLLAFGEYTLFEYRGMYTINEACSIELFQGLRRDLAKLSLGTYFAQVSDVISQEDVPSSELLSLTLNSLYALDKLSISTQQVKATFELRCACLAGYLPELSGCYKCKEPFPQRFNVTEGRLECTSCKDPVSNGLRMPLTPGVLECMRYICTCDSKKLFAYQAGFDTVEHLAQVTETYLTSQLERGFPTLDFYKSIQM